MENTNEKGVSGWVYAIVIFLAIGALLFFSLRTSAPERVNVPFDNTDVIIGDINAPVTIVEFTDFSCPYCAAAEGYSQQYMNALKSGDASWQAPMPAVYENYVKSGKVKIVVKYYPGHGTGQEAHKVGWSLYAQMPQKFNEYKGKVFAQQENANDAKAMTDIAVSLGADRAQIEKDLAEKKYDSKLNEQTLHGMNAGVQGTPTFFINGVKLSGALPYSEFERIIEEELN